MKQYLGNINSKLEGIDYRNFIASKIKEYTTEVNLNICNTYLKDYSFSTSVEDISSNITTNPDKTYFTSDRYTYGEDCINNTVFGDGFPNIISEYYLLKDYMINNNYDNCENPKVSFLDESTKIKLSNSYYSMISNIIFYIYKSIKDDIILRLNSIYPDHTFNIKFYKLKDCNYKIISKAIKHLYGYYAYYQHIENNAEFKSSNTLFNPYIALLCNKYFNFEKGYFVTRPTLSLLPMKRTYDCIVTFPFINTVHLNYKTESYKIDNSSKYINDDSIFKTMVSNGLIVKKFLIGNIFNSLCIEIYDNTIDNTVLIYFSEDGNKYKLIKNCNSISQFSKYSNIAYKKNNNEQVTTYQKNKDKIKFNEISACKMYSNICDDFTTELLKWQRKLNDDFILNNQYINDKCLNEIYSFYWNHYRMSIIPSSLIQLLTKVPYYSHEVPSLSGKYIDSIPIYYCADNNTYKFNPDAIKFTIKIPTILTALIPIYADIIKNMLTSLYFEIPIDKLLSYEYNDDYEKLALYINSLILEDANISEQYKSIIKNITSLDNMDKVLTDYYLDRVGTDPNYLVNIEKYKYEPDILASLYLIYKYLLPKSIELYRDKYRDLLYNINIDNTDYIITTKKAYKENKLIEASLNKIKKNYDCGKLIKVGGSNFDINTMLLQLRYYSDNEVNLSVTNLDLKD